MKGEEIRVKLIKYIKGFLTVALILPLVIFASTAFSGPSGKDLPSIIGLSTFGQGSKPYVIITAMSNAIERQTGIKVRVIPAVTDKARIMTVLRGEALGGYVGMATYVGAGGILEWLTEGPQNFSMIWAGAPAVVTIVVKKDSGIRTWADIKGKRVADCRKISPAAGMVSEGNLSFGGITFNDVISVPLPPYAPSTKALMDGAVDVSFDGTATPTIYELESSSHGVFTFETPPENVEGWTRFNKACPPYRPYPFTWGVGASKTKPKWWPANIIQLFCRPDANEEVIYTVAKAIHDGYALFKDAHGECAEWTINNALDLNLLRGLFIPYHPGAIRFFQEKGKWTDKHDTWQKSRINFHRKVMEAYHETVSRTTKMGIARGSKDFEKFWNPNWDQLAQQLALEK